MWAPTGRFRVTLVPASNSRPTSESVLFWVGVGLGVGGWGWVGVGLGLGWGWGWGWGWVGVGLGWGWVGVGFGLGWGLGGVGVGVGVGVGGNARLAAGNQRKPTETDDSAITRSRRGYYAIDFELRGRR